jgi:hypothetical protein
MIAANARTKGRAKWMSIFQHKEHIIQQIFPNFKLVGDLFQTKDNYRVNLNLFKNADLAGLKGRAKMIFNNIKKAVATSATKTVEELFTPTFEFCRKENETHLEHTCMKSDKGTSFIYKQRILKIAEKRKINVAPAYYTWPSKLQHNMTMDEWFKALDNINKYLMSPKAKWCTHQIFLRTIWTPLKDAEASHGTKTPDCPNCVEPRADTQHMFLYCPLARRIWRRVEKIITKAQESQISYKLTNQKILFHRQIKNEYETMLIIAGKYAISRLTRSVINRPKNPKVIDAFLKTQILQITRAHVIMFKKVSLWLGIERATHYVLQFADTNV